MDKETQAAKILKAFKQHGTLTNIELNKICYRYSARVHDLNKEFAEAGTGERIISTREKGAIWRFIYLEPSEQVELL